MSDRQTSSNENPVYQSDSRSKTPSILNGSSLSFDVLNGNNARSLKTRYDTKSSCSNSLYGSKATVQTPVLIPNPNTIRRSQRVKKYILNKVFTDTAYADGEYEPGEEIDLSGPKEENRDTWSGRFDFFLSCLGYAVGLGAVWRFPYLCYKNGGGVFLIPYLIFLFFVGIPLFYLELNIGQFTSQGPILCWKMAPIFKGLGISMNISSFYFCLYYNMIIAYSLYFLYNSFQSPLPWSKCEYSWSSPNCTDDFGEDFVVKCNQADVYRDDNGLCYNYSGPAGKTQIGWWNVQKRLEFKKPILPSQDYYNNYILQKTPGLENSGTLVWQLVLCLGIAWIIVFLCIFKGIKSSGKVVYFTSLFPYVVLLILGINGWTLPGAGIGIEFYLKPDFNKLLEISVWFDAAVQIFFTMSTSYGGLITLASYNKFNQHTLRDTFVITISNALTAIFAGFVVFSYIGYLAEVTQQEVKDVVSSGSGLSFIVFPFAVTQLVGAPFWSVIFFIMMLTLGLDSQFATLETIITSVCDGVPRVKKYKKLLIAFLCTVMYLLGLTYCTQGGQYWIEIMDRFASGWAVLLIGTLECICIGWVYGYKNFQKDISLMIGKNCLDCCLSWYWSLCWKFVSPILLFGLAIFSIIQYKPLQTDDYVFPVWANWIGHLMTASILSGIVGWAIYMLIDATCINKRSLRTLIEPEKDWGPLLIEHKRLAIHLKNLSNFHTLEADNKKLSKAQAHVNAVMVA
ncbi:sodium-dependent proline transporter-like [Brachionus plicatilis]|uniref:Transporter n=1 Tax=Brachionus plicatilis TaxID=10195 RepID=A0A3M7RZQ9_BRAPC|nr:sodium-dependent proline transporter-like [Brachionus plicatilis]